MLLALHWDVAANKLVLVIVIRFESSELDSEQRNPSDTEPVAPETGLSVRVASVPVPVTPTVFPIGSVPEMTISPDFVVSVVTVGK